MNITVYAGSAASLPAEYLAQAAATGAAIAGAGATMVYGAGRTGLMGAAADACIAGGGSVVGIIPEFMVERGWHHRGLTELVVTDGMHTRKNKMMEMANGVIALPGGIGTFEELTEAITWRQLGLYSGNIVILNTGGYYDSLIAQLDRATAEGFMKPDHRAAVAVTESPEEAVSLAMQAVEPRTFSPKF